MCALKKAAFSGASLPMQIWLHHAHTEIHAIYRYCVYYDETKMICIYPGNATADVK